MIGQTISHYRIVSQLGAGGMGVVYAAQDPRLNRQVALKFVPDELAHDPHTIERLRSEARTASGLNHPNICTIYDIGEHEGRPFIVMELLKGHTLRERMAVRPLKIHEAVDIGIQVADALYWAHSRDVIHRDIKPANLFLVDQGQVKILDFGLAKFVAPQAGTDTTLAPTIDLTGVGVALGTVAYMSPEQVSGDILDRRTDLFSLGVVLYECVTGQQPFQGKTSAVVLASILTQQPTPPMALNASVPHGLQEIIHNCLEKDRELRFQDAAGLRADLKRVKRDLESGALRVAHTTSVSTVNAAAPPSEGLTSPIPIERPDSGSTGTRQPPPAANNSRMVAGIAVAAIVVAAIAGGIVMSRRGAALPETARVVETTPSPAAPATEPPAAQPTPPAPVPQDPAAERARAEARAATARFDAAIVDANRFLAAGDADAATRALNTARAIDPGAPAVADLSARLVEHFKAESARRTTTDPVRPQPPQRRPAEPAGRQAQPPAATPQPAPSPATPPADVTPPPASPPPVAPRPPAPEPAVVAAPVVPPPARTEPERRPAPAVTPTPPPAPVEDDDTIIRRVVATYGKAIETKDLALYRSVKPNLSGAEQRTIEDGFRAVSSQRVTINIQSIEHRGQEAIVRLRRQDVIQAGGRQQTADSQQSLTLVRSGSGWVIREIGR